jgi:hypothetical protein
MINVLWGIVIFLMLCLALNEAIGLRHTRKRKQIGWPPPDHAQEVVVLGVTYARDEHRGQWYEIWATGLDWQ